MFHDERGRDISAPLGARKDGSPAPSYGAAMKVEKRFYVPLLTKASISGDDRFIEGTASSSALDRQGDTIEASAIEDMTARAKGTSILLNHSHVLPHDAIGYIVDAQTIKDNGGSKLVMRAILDPDPENVNARRTWNQIQFGFSHGLSIGARLIDFDFRDEEDPFAGLNIKALELFEVSVVTVPANQDCYVRGIAGEIGLQVRDVMRSLNGGSKTKTFAFKAALLGTTIAPDPHDDDVDDDDDDETDRDDRGDDGDDDMKPDARKKLLARTKKLSDRRKADGDLAPSDAPPADTGAEGGTLDEQLGTISDALMEAHDAVAAAAEAVDDPDITTALQAAAETIDTETDHIDAVQEEVATQTAALSDLKSQVHNEEKKLDRLLMSIKALEARKRDLEGARAGKRSVSTYEDIEDPGERTYARMAAPRSVMLGNLSDALRNR